jgi:hypothetical protein
MVLSVMHMPLSSIQIYLVISVFVFSLVLSHLAKFPPLQNFLTQATNETPARQKPEIGKYISL